MPYIHFIQIRSTCFYTVHNNVFVCSSLVDSISSFKHPLSLKLDWSSAGLNKTVGSFTLIIREVLMVSVKWGVGGFRNVKGKCTNSVLKNNTSATNTHTQPAVGHRFRLWFWCCHWCLNWTWTVWVTNRVYNIKQQWRYKTAEHHQDFIIICPAGGVCGLNSISA